MRLHRKPPWQQRIVAGQQGVSACSQTGRQHRARQGHLIAHPQTRLTFMHIQGRHRRVETGQHGKKPLQNVLRTTGTRQKFIGFNLPTATQIELRTGLLLHHGGFDFDGFGWQMHFTEHPIGRQTGGQFQILFVGQGVIPIGPVGHGPQQHRGSFIARHRGQAAGLEYHRLHGQQTDLTLRCQQTPALFNLVCTQGQAASGGQYRPCITRLARNFQLTRLRISLRCCQLKLGEGAGVNLLCLQIQSTARGKAALHLHGDGLQFLHSQFVFHLYG